MSPIYKYFSKQCHLQSFLENGEIYFNSLSYFLSCDDDSRRDRSEDVTLYRPKSGLVGNIVTTGKPFALPAQQLISRVNASDSIFVFCTSAEFSVRLYQKFNAEGCIEISNPDEFKERLQAKINELVDGGNGANKTLLAGRIEYYDSAESPGARHACPDQIVMAKPDHFSDEAEFRFAFAKDQNAFDVNNVQYSISSELDAPNAASRHLSLRLGSLTDICQVRSIDIDAP